MGCQTNCVFPHFFLTPPLHPLCDTDLNIKYKKTKKTYKNIKTTKKVKKSQNPKKPTKHKNNKKVKKLKIKLQLKVI